MKDNESEKQTMTESTKNTPKSKPLTSTQAAALQKLYEELWTIFEDWLKRKGIFPIRGRAEKKGYIPYQVTDEVADFIQVRDELADLIKAARDPQDYKAKYEAEVAAHETTKQAGLLTEGKEKLK
jgi:hypothetical protein